MENWNSIDRTIILASGSPRRKELLTQMGVNFRIEVESIDNEEIFFETYPLTEALTKLSRAKGKAVAQRNSNSLVISGDTIVVANDKQYGKPKDRNDARSMIELFSGNTHSVFTCVSLECTDINFHADIISETKVTFRELEPWEIENYLDVSQYRDKAGSYGIQDEALTFVESISGCYSNVVGFPISSVIALFKQYKQFVKGDKK